MLILVHVATRDPLFRHFSGSCSSGFRRRGAGQGSATRSRRAWPLRASTACTLEVIGGEELKEPAPPATRRAGGGFGRGNSLPSALGAVQSADFLPIQPLKCRKSPGILITFEAINLTRIRHDWEPKSVGIVTGAMCVTAIPSFCRPSYRPTGRWLSPLCNLSLVRLRYSLRPASLRSALLLDDRSTGVVAACPVLPPIHQ